MKKILIGLLALTLNASAAYKIQTQGVKTSAECIAAGATDATCLIKDSQIYSSGLGGRLDQAITAGTLGSKLTTKGDLQTFSTVNTRLGVGANGTVLTADSTATEGIAWAYPSGGSGTGSIENLITNPTAEDLGKVASDTWTCTNATATISTGNAASPTHNFVLTATSAGGYCETSFTTLAGRVNHDSYFYYKTTASDVTLGAYLGTSLQNSATLAAKSAMAESSHVTFITDGTAQSGKLRVTMPTDTTVVYIDDLYAGLNQNIGSVAQAVVKGAIEWQNTTSCRWETTSSSFSNFSNVAACDDNTRTVLFDAVDSSAGQRPEIQITNASAGYYVVDVMGSINSGTASSAIYSQSMWTVSDGTNQWNTNFQSLYASGATGARYLTLPHMQFSRYYPTAPGTLTLNVQGKQQSGSDSAYLDAQSQNLSIVVKFYPTSNQTAVRVGTEAMSWSGYMSGTDCEQSLTQTTYAADFGADADCVLVQRQNNNFPAVTKFDSNGYTFTPTKTGMFELEGSISVQIGTADKISGCEMIDELGTVIDDKGQENYDANTVFNVSLSGTLPITSLTSKTIKFRCKVAAGTITMTGKAGAIAHSLKITDISQNKPQPVIVNSVTHSKANQQRIVRGGISSCGGSTTISDAGTGDFTLTANGTGDCTINFSPAFSSTSYTCTANPNTGDSVAVRMRTRTVNAQNLQSFTTAGAALADYPVDFICIGDK